MIRISENAIFMVREDGSSCSFDFDRLREKIETCCVKCGIKDSWFSDDIALSVEYVLHQLASEGRMFSESELDYYVVEVLEKAGLDKIAEQYREHTSSDSFISTDLNTISDLISRNFKILPEETARLSGKVFEVFEKLEIARTSPGFIMESARFFIEHEKASSCPVQKKQTHTQDAVRPFDFKNPWVLKPEDIIPKLSPACMLHVNSGVLRPLSVSRLFPSIKIELDLVRLSEKNGLVPPYTEMLISPFVDALRPAIVEIAETVGKEYHRLFPAGCEESPKEENESLHAYIKLPKLKQFVSGHLLLEWDSCAGSLRYIFDRISVGTGLSFPEIPHAKQVEKFGNNILLL